MPDPGQGLIEAGKAISGYADFLEQKKLNEAKLQDLAQLRQQRQQEAMAAHADMVDKANQRTNELDSNIITLDDPSQVDAALQQNEQVYSAYSPILGKPYDSKAKLADLKAKQKLIGGPNGLLKQFNDLVGQVQQVSGFKGAFGSPTIDEAAKNAKALGRKINNIAPGATSMLKGGLDAIDTYQQKRQAGNQALYEAREKAKQQGNKPQAETAFQKKQRSVQAETYAKALDALPAMQQDTQNLDNAMKIADRVFTGPLAGKSIAYGLQKISSEDAQQLNYYLSKENVIKIMEFAKSAGVRSIDTPQEQQRLLDSIANKEQSPKVLKKNLMQMKSLQEQAIRLTQAKQQHVSQYGNLDTFNPLSLSKQQEPAEHPLINKLKFD